MPPVLATRQRLAKIGLVAAVAVGLIAAHQLGLFEQFRDPARVKATLIELGAAGYAVFVVSYMLLQPFGVPGTAFILAAPLVWPWPVAFLLSMTGTMAASVVGFAFARFVARDWIAARIPARFRRYDEALARRAFATVFWLRLVFWMPPMLHAFFGISQVRFWTHFWGSLAGYVLPLLLVSFFGEKLFEWMQQAPPSVWIGMGVAFVLVVLAFSWVRRRRSALVAPTASPPTSAVTGESELEGGAASSAEAPTATE